VNAYDQKLIFSTTEEKDWVSILVIGGIEVFLLQNLIESIACVSDAKKKTISSDCCREGEGSYIDAYRNRIRREWH
jgi:hypothetical protein